MRRNAPLRGDGCVLEHMIGKEEAMATFGIRFLDHLAPAKTLVEWAVLAEHKGFDFCWFPHDILCKNTWIMTTAVAMVTERIRIGSVGTNPYTTDPSEIATYIATLDELSKGRAVLGLGLHTEKMVEWLGIKAKDMLTRSRESIDIIRLLLKGGVVAYHGKEFHWTDQCYLRFKPYRDHVPIYACGFGDGYLALTGEIGDGSLPMVTPPESAKRMVNAIYEGLRKSGRKPGDIDIAGCGWFSVSESRKAAQGTIRKIIAYFGPYLEEEALNTVGLSLRQFAEIKGKVAMGLYEEAESLVTDQMLDLAIVGTPKQIIPRIQLLLESGITQVAIGGPLGPDPRRTIELLGDQVLPYFR
jgi:5,10-methylenetetrahydromethanopterin reductase